MVRVQTVLGSDSHRDLPLHVWAGEIPLFMTQSQHSDLTGTPPILLATLHSLWEKINPAGEGQVNIWYPES